MDNDTIDNNTVKLNLQDTRQSPIVCKDMKTNFTKLHILQNKNL